MRRMRGTAAAVALGLAAAMSVPAVGAAAEPPSPEGPDVDVIVRYAPGVGPGTAKRAVTRAGGAVGRSLPVVDGFTAQVPAGALSAVRSAAGVKAVTPNGPVRLASDTEAWLADKDINSLYSIARSAGVPDAWEQSDANGQHITGAGVGVALIDSGVAPVRGLDGAGKVINGPDLSFESQADNLRHLDTFGHGTHLAGIIAGRDPGVTDAGLTSPGAFVGVAPGAHLINLKVAAADGATDVSQVIAAIDWVVQHRDDEGLNIRVLNLSFGTDSVQDARLDPLSFAVEVAWRAGIVVVVAVGNDGPDRDVVSMPAANPYVIATGAVDPNQTELRRDDTVADFSTAGNAVRHADILAAGRSVVSLRTPGSYVDAHYPQGRLAGDPAQRYFRGSGSSQSTAVVSGAAALLLQQRPTLAPDEVKALLTASAEALPAAAGSSFGTGQLNVGKALRLPTLRAHQAFPAATGQGSIEAARGSAHVADAETGIELAGEQDIFGQAWQPAVWAPAAAQGTSWNGGRWNGTDWTGTDWTGTSWAARTWGARTWGARTWNGSTWAARTWNDAVWSGQSWTARTWGSNTWTARTWGGSAWS